jgi:DNA polymerase I-like protein with 3'-5' exonuclease and polymerase domains
MIIVDTETLEQRNSELTDSEIYWTYCGLDTCVTYDVIKVIEPQLDEVARATYHTSLATLPVVLEMMLEGLLVDLVKRQEVLQHYEAQHRKLEDAFIRLCVEGLGLPHDRTKRTGGRRPVPINEASPKDVQYLFHTVLGVPEKRKRKKGQSEAKATTDRDALEGFRSYYFAEVFVNFILAMRDCNKVIGFLRTRLSADNKIRCSFNVAGTKTGRLNSSFDDFGDGTNLQNISGKQKNIFIAEPTYCMVDIDLEQGDSRGVGAICWSWFVEKYGEEWAGRYLDACESGDLHTTVTRMAWTSLGWPVGLDPKECKKIAEQIAYRDLTYRDLSKKLGHGSNYLGQPKTMAMHTKLPVGIISDFQRRYFGEFQCITEWQKQTIDLIKTERCLTTPFGRRRWFWDDPNAQSTHNAAIAYSPQSTTGEFINRGAIQLWHHRNKVNLPVRFKLQVHDSLVLLVKWKALEETIPVILDKLKVVLPLAKGRDFTIPHGVKVGFNYGMTEFNPDGTVKDNFYGMRKWTGHDDRTPPKNLSSLEAMLNAPLKSR